MALIALSGVAYSGKDEFARLIQKLDPSYENKKFAGKLKEVASLLLGVPVRSFENREFKESPLGTEWWTSGEDGDHPMSVREFLQILGTEGLREGLHKNVWVNALFADYRRAAKLVPSDNTFSDYKVEYIGDYPNWVVSDCRFKNEAQAIKDRGGYVVRIDRPGGKPVNNHASETDLDDWNFDFKIANVSDLTALEFSAKCLLDDIKA